MTRRDTGPTRSVVDLVWARAEASCERCRRGLSRTDRGFGWSIHHRSPRGAGGSKLAWKNQPANLLVLCGSGTTGCHGWVEANRETALTSGLLISVNAKTPARFHPVILGGAQTYLDDEGERHDEDLPF